MMRLICTDCRAKMILADDEERGMHFMFHHGIVKTDRPIGDTVFSSADKDGNVRRTVIPNNSPCVCDNCNVVIPKGTRAVCWSAWMERRPIDLSWVDDYLDNIDHVEGRQW